jgi:hypothetical protein
LTYAFDVQGGMQDIDLGVSIPDNSYNLEGVLVTPDGRPIDVQSTVTTLNAFGQPATLTSTMQFFYRNPASGRWRFVLLINDTISGNQTSLPFQATIGFNGVRVSASGVPDDPRVRVASGKPLVAQVTVVNTGNTAKDFFLDPRLTQYGQVSLGGVDYTLPVTVGVVLPDFYVPPESTSLAVVIESMTPTVPVNMDIFNVNGAPPYGGTGSPDIEATTTKDPQTGNFAAVAISNAPEVVPGFWGIGPTEVGPFPAAGAPPSTGASAGLVLTRLFDASANPTTGDAHAILTGQASGPYQPLGLPPGASGTITVTFAPSAPIGTVVSGLLYVDAFNQNSATVGLTTGIGDELAAIPYTYTVGAH